MNLVQTAVNQGMSGTVVVETITFNGQTTQGNLLIVTGTWADVTTGTITTIPTVTDSAGNLYLIASVPFHNGLGQDWWVQYCVAGFTTSITVTVNYSAAVSSAGVGVHEFLVETGWNSGSLTDGTHHANTGPLVGSTPINSGSITTTNADDLILALVTYSQVGLTLSTGWSLASTIQLGTSTAWIEQPTAASVTFIATQGGGGSGVWSAGIWAFQALPAPAPPITFTLITATVNPTQFQESYQNRIPEDIYDSLSENPNFIFVPYGPSPLNV